MKGIRLTYVGLLLVLLSAAPAHLMALRHSGGQDVEKMFHSIKVGQGESVDGGATCFGCSVTIDGSLGGDVAVFFGSVTINGDVAGDVAVFGGELKLGPASSVGGDVAVFGGDINRDPNSAVHGKVAQFGGPLFFGVGTLGILGVLLLMGSALGVLIYLLCYAIAGRPRIETTTAVVSGNMGQAAIYGFGAALVGVGLILGAAVALGGASRVVVLVTLGLALLVFVLVGNTAVALWLGRMVAKSAGPVGAIVIGSILLVVIQFVPVLGAVAHIFLQLVGLGAAALTGLGASQAWLQQNLFGHTPPPAAPVG